MPRHSFIESTDYVHIRILHGDVVVASLTVNKTDIDHVVYTTVSLGYTIRIQSSLGDEEEYTYEED